MNPVIKKSNRNEYVLTQDGIWVRNFCEDGAPYMDINRLTRPEEYPEILANELEQVKKKNTNIDTEDIIRPKIVIVSDGYQFKSKHKILSSLGPDITIICVNGALAEWELVGDDCPAEDKRAISFYVVNNPFKECEGYLPKKKKYYPRCIASARTNYKFLNSYKGNKYIYSPVNDQYYSGPNFNSQYKIDDYRNPICSAIGLAYRFGVEKLLLFCCDDSFQDSRPSAIELDKNIWCYPQQLVSQRIIDANLYWLNRKNISIGNHSSGLKLENARYINEKEIISFFKDE